MTAVVAVRDATVPRSGVRGAEMTLVIAMSLYRGYGISQAVVAILLDARRYADLPMVVLLAAAISLSTLTLIWLCLRAGRIRDDVVVADTLVIMAGLVVGAKLTSPHDGHTWIYFMYPVSLVSSLAIGLAFDQFAAVAALTFALSAAYAGSAMIIHHDPLWNVLPNTLSYPANTTAAWAGARYLRSTGRRLDQTRRLSVEQAARIASEQTRAQHARVLHDRVLQTLETLACTEWISDPSLRSHIAAEAAWLRAFVEGDQRGTEPDLLTDLQRLVQRKARTGLHVELNCAQLREDGRWRQAIPAAHQAALVDAAQEALTNVAKHAGVNHASIRARVTDRGIELSIMDRGRGFTFEADAPGVGLRSSIIGRMAEIGGTASIESTPGVGTVVRLTARADGLVAPPGEQRTPD